MRAGIILHAGDTVVCLLMSFHPLPSLSLVSFCVCVCVCGGGGGGGDKFLKKRI